MGYYDSDHETIGVNSKGIAETAFTSATFKASVTCSGKTGPEAKAKAEPIIEKIRSAILAHAEPAKVETSKMRTTFGVDVETHRQTGEFVGYRATYTISFTGRNVKHAPVIHDALTSLEGVQSPTPVYNVNDAVEIQSQAFHDAVVKAQAKFAGQCAALSLNPSDFFVQSWVVQEEQARGKTLSFSDGASPKPVGLEPGKASLEMNVTFVYARKPEKSPAHAAGTGTTSVRPPSGG